ncbi:MAG: hypothetical protein FWD46_03925 [Cystobacterineae bacterium]|nr:hypothetical protein [Cystobacterineae bacterium]
MQGSIKAKGRRQASLPNPLLPGGLKPEPSAVCMAPTVASFEAAVHSKEGALRTVLIRFNLAPRVRPLLMQTN